MKLHSEVLESNNPTEIPSFVKLKLVPDGADQVNAIHVTKNNHSAFFICGNSYFVLTKNSGDEESFSQIRPYSDIIEEAGSG